VRWFGGSRDLAKLTAPEIASYAERHASSGADVARLEPIKAFYAQAKKARLTSSNLGVHLRVSKSSASKKSNQSRRPARKVALTQAGFDRLAKELEELRKERPHIALEIRKAAADKDFRENAPLDAAREHQGQVEARIRELEATLKVATIIDEGSADGTKAELGSTVVIHDLAHNESLRYTLVHPNEASPARAKISIASPLGKALVDQGEGAEIEVSAPAGVMRYRIEKIER
jgi:transcription elongation factor GreA